MNHPQDTGAFTTVSGMIGGVVKAISVKPVMISITFSSLANVMIYAAAYVGIGYNVKKHSIRFQIISIQSLTETFTSSNKFRQVLIKIK
jgi:hypothetical protein